MASPTTIYLSPKQRKALFARARTRSTTFSDEVRSAVELYLEFPPDFDKEAFAQLAREANASMDRSIARLDETIAGCEQTLERMNELERRERNIGGVQKGRDHGGTHRPVG